MQPFRKRWTDAASDLCVTLAATGKSNKHIARALTAFGFRVSVNGVKGRLVALKKQASVKTAPAPILKDVRRLQVKGRPNPWAAWDARLREMWASGLRVSLIADALTKEGFAVNRNAVIGRAGRLGLPRHAKASTPPVALQASEGGQGAGLFPGSKWPLNPRACLYPTGDPHAKDFHFCGKIHGQQGRPYCPPHHELTHRASDYVQA